MAPEGVVPAFLFARPLRVPNPQLWAKRFGPGLAAQKKPAYSRVSYVFTRLNAEAHARPRPPHQIPVVRLLARTE